MTISFQEKFIVVRAYPHVNQESFDDGNHSLVDMLDNIKKFGFLNVAELDKVFCMKCGNDNKDCIFVCETSGNCFACKKKICLYPN